MKIFSENRLPLVCLLPSTASGAITTFTLNVVYNITKSVLLFFNDITQHPVTSLSLKENTGIKSLHTYLHRSSNEQHLKISLVKSASKSNNTERLKTEIA